MGESIHDIHYRIRVGPANPVRMRICAECETPWPCRTIQAATPAAEPEETP